MHITSPKDVLTIVSKDLKARHLSQERVAEMTGYKSRQAISLMLKSGKYMNTTQAKAFHDAFGYYEGFLTAGEGSLMSDKPDPRQLAQYDSAVYPEVILNLRPFDDKESFKKAFDRLLDKINLVYGEESVRNLMLLCLRYFDLYVEKKEVDDVERVIQLRRKRGPFFTKSEEEFRKHYQSKEYEEYAEKRLNGIMGSLYPLYMELSEKCL